MQAIHVNAFEMEPVALSSQPQKFQKVFLVDNNRLDTFKNTRALAQQDFAEELTTFESAQSAINCLREASRLDEVPDLIFLNIDMPGMDGFTFLQQFGKLNDFTRNRCRIVMMSSVCNDVDRKKCLMNRSVVQYLPKQLNKRMLAQFD